MDAIEFLNSDLVELPKRRAEPDFLNFAQTLLDDYCSELANVSGNDVPALVLRSRLPYARQLSQALIQTLRYCLAKSHAQAFDQISQAITSSGLHFDALCPTVDMSGYISPLYRMRAGKGFDRGGVFHIPFQLANLVAAMRYSVKGLPCLYFGGSTHVCWRELNEPDLSTISVARFVPVSNSGLKILNFGWRPSLMAAHVASQPQDFQDANSDTARLGAVVATWPLVALCSIKKLDPDGTFHPEYLVPQLVLQWITSQREYHGIRYFSTHYPQFPDDPKTYMNYVFPARSLASTGHCSDLTSLFELTEPATWDDLKVKQASRAIRPIYKTKKIEDQALENEFGHVEDVLMAMPTASL